MWKSLMVVTVRDNFHICFPIVTLTCRISTRSKQNNQKKRLTNKRAPSRATSYMGIVQKRQGFILRVGGGPPWKLVLLLDQQLPPFVS